MNIGASGTITMALKAKQQQEKREKNNTKERIYIQLIEFCRWLTDKPFPSNERGGNHFHASSALAHNQVKYWEYRKKGL